MVSNINNYNVPNNDPDLVAAADDPNLIPTNHVMQAMLANLREMSPKQAVSHLQKTLDASPHNFEVKQPIDYLFDKKGVVMYHKSEHSANFKGTSPPKKGIFNKVTNEITPTIEDFDEVRQLGNNFNAILHNADGKTTHLSVTFGAPIEAQEMRKFERAYITYHVASRILNDIRAKEEEKKQKEIENKLNHHHPQKVIKSKFKFKQKNKKNNHKDLTNFSESKITSISRCFKSKLFEIGTIEKKRRIEVASEKADESDEKIQMHKEKTNKEGEILKKDKSYSEQKITDEKKAKTLNKRNISVSSLGEFTQVSLEENCEGKISKIFKESISGVQCLF